MNIVLCGMMGAGKTSVGEHIAALTGRHLVDTDAVITQRHGKISDIFAQHGEAYFRTLETQTVSELSAQDNLVIATGGGLVLKAENCELLKLGGTIFFLRASVETLLERVGNDKSRPLLQGDAEKRMRELLSVRMPVYERVADHIIDTDGKSVDEVAREIVAHMEGV